MEVFYRQQTSVGVLWAVRGISTHGSRKGRNLLVRGKKGKREYGSGRAQLGIQSNKTTSEKSKQSGGSAAEYLHFGRLIGESAEESSKRLEEISGSVKKDKRAELYLEKWSHEEEMSYQMFETLLGGDTEKSAAMRQLSFESIMNEEDEEIEAAFESLVLEAVPEHAAGGQERSSEPLVVEEKKPIVEQEEPVEPPTYDAFDSLLNPEAAQVAEEPEPLEAKTQESDAKQMKKQANVSRAKVFEREQRIVEATVWQVNVSGVLVQAKGVTGFVPFNQLSKEHKFKVSDAQKQAQRVIGGSTEDAKVRKAGMHVLTGSVLHVAVMSVDEEAGRVIFTERVKRQNQTAPLTESILKQVSQQVGNIVDAHVRNVRDFGVFVDFAIHDQVSNTQVSVLGLVYTTEVSWDAERPRISPGDTLKAKVIHVDIPKKHIFLSFKRTTPNPLLETLDSLLDTTTTAQNAHGLTEEESRTTFDASSDMRPLLGDLEDAVKLKSLLETVQGVQNVTLGPRLQSRASSQNVEIYLAKAEESNGTKKVIVRRGYDVQEMAIQSSGLVSRQDLIDIISQQQ